MESKLERKERERLYSQEYRQNKKKMSSAKRARESIIDEDVKLEKSSLLQRAFDSYAGKINKTFFYMFILLI